MLSRTPEELRSTLEDIGSKRKVIDEAVAGFPERRAQRAGQATHWHGQRKAGGFLDRQVRPTWE